MRVLFFSCEPGGAEVLIPVIRLLDQKCCETVVVGYGYALDCFVRKNVQCIQIAPVMKDDFTLLDRHKPDIVITSATSLPHRDMSEKYLWYNSSQYGIKTIAFLDQWQNYSIRFSGTGAGERHLYLPDFINCINNIGRREMIAEGFSEDRLVEFGHPYLDEVAEYAGRIDRECILNSLGLMPGRPVFLFVSEAIYEHYGHSRGYDQYQVLEIFLNNLYSHGVDAEVVVKLHPKDDFTKFGDIKKRYKEILIVKNELSPAESVVAADAVYGMTSVMLIEAYITGKPVVSIQPGPALKDELVLSRYGLIPLVREPWELDFKNSVPHCGNVGFTYNFDSQGFMSFLKKINCSR